MSLVYLCQIAVSAALHNIFYDPVWIWARSFLRWMTRIIEMSSSIPRWLNFSNTIKHSHWKYLTLNEEAVSQRLFVYRARPSCIDGDPTLKLNQVKHQRQVEDSSKNKSLVSRRRGLRGLDPSRRPPFFSLHQPLHAPSLSRTDEASVDYRSRPFRYRIVAVTRHDIANNTTTARAAQKCVVCYIHNTLQSPPMHQDRQPSSQLTLSMASYTQCQLWTFLVSVLRQQRCCWTA